MESVAAADDVVEGGALPELLELIHWQHHLHGNNGKRLEVMSTTLRREVLALAVPIWHSTSLHLGRCLILVVALPKPNESHLVKTRTNIDVIGSEVSVCISI